MQCQLRSALAAGIHKCGALPYAHKPPTGPPSVRPGGVRQVQQRCLRTACIAEPRPQVTVPEGLAAAPWTGSDEQLQALAQLEQRFAGVKPQPDTATLQWFLRDRRFDVDEAVSKLQSNLEWRKQYGIDGLTHADVAAELATGKGYVHEHTDIYGRPVMVIRTKYHKTGEFPLDDSKRLCGYMLDDALSRLQPGGETILGMIDLKGFGRENADIGFALFMVEAFFTYYPKRVSQVLLVDAPWVFQPTYAVIKPLLRKYSKLVRFVDREQVAAEYFTPKTLPPDFV